MVWRYFESGSFSSAFELSKLEEKWANCTHEASIVRVHFIHTYPYQLDGLLEKVLAVAEGCLLGPKLHT